MNGLAAWAMDETRRARNNFFINFPPIFLFIKIVFIYGLTREPSAGFQSNSLKKIWTYGANAMRARQRVKEWAILG
jgi:hypothetical protein